MFSCTVAIPVGPLPQHREHLDEAIASVRAQTHPSKLLLVDDMAGLVPCDATVVKNYWRLGVAGSFNVGVGAAETELVFMLGSDDTLQPDCIERCVQAYEGLKEPVRSMTVFCVGVHYMNAAQPDQFVPCNAMMVSKSVWARTGGFPPMSAVAACDSMFFSIALAKGDEFCRVMIVAPDKTLYNYRVVGNSATADGASLQPAIFNIRDVLSRTWSRPNWGRYT